MRFAEISEAEFKKFAEKNGGSFLQSVEMYKRYKRRKDEVYLVGLFCDRELKCELKCELRAVALVVKKYEKFGQKIYVSPRGFLMDFEAEDAGQVFSEFSGEIKKFLKKKKGMVFSISPNVVRIRETSESGELIPTDEKWLGDKVTEMALRSGYKNLGEYEFVKWIYTVSLAMREDELFAGLRRNHRRLIKSAEKAGLKIRKLGADELEILGKLTEETGERKGFSSQSTEYFKEMAGAFGEKIEFVVAETPEGEAVEAAMFIRDNDRIIVPYSGAKTGMQKLGGMQFVMYEEMKKAIREGFKEFDFYGTHPIVSDGVYEFKRGFHGQIEEYVGTFMMPISALGWFFVLKQKYEEMRGLH